MFEVNQFANANKWADEDAVYFFAEGTEAKQPMRGWRE